MHRKAHLYILCLLLVMCSFTTTAQLQVWRHVNTADMTNTNIMCMTEDASGLLYLGTQGGVEIFDGRRFVPLVIPDHIKRGINPFVNSFRWGRGGVLWVNTRTHIFTYKPATGEVTVVYGAGNEAALNITSIQLDTVRQQLYIARNDGVTICKLTEAGIEEVKKIQLAVLRETTLDNAGNLYVITDSNRRVVRINVGLAETVYSSAFVRDADYLPKQNSLLLLTAEGLVTIALANGKADTLAVKPPGNVHAAKSMITVMWDGEIMLHHADGISLLKSATDTAAIHFAADPKNPCAIQTDFVIYSFKDRRGNLWISEDGISISVLPANARHVRFLSAKMTGAARLWLSWHDTVNHQILSSSEKGFCALYYNSNKADYRPEIRPAENMKFFQPMFYMPWAKDELLVVTNGQGCWLFDTKTYKGRGFDAINKKISVTNYWGGQQIDKDKVMLHEFFGSYIFDRKTATVSAILRDSSAQQFNQTNPGKLELLSSYKDSKKRYWFGSGYGILVTDSNLQRLRIYGQNQKTRNDGLGNTVIMNTHEAANGAIYTATMGGGVFRLTAADTFESVPLAGNVTNIYCIGTTDKDHLCITTGNGICRYNTTSGISQLINANYGMPIGDFNQYALSIDQQFVVASGSNGITVIDRNGFDKSFYDTAQLLVLKNMSPVSRFVLEKGKQLLEFDIAITGYAAGANWKIRYKLDGVDDTWREMEKGEWHIRYNSIPPGEYTLRVVATDRHNVVYTAPATVLITALPYFWQTLWFRLLVLALCISVLVVTVRFFSQLQLKWRLKKMEDEQKMSRERLRISRELHDNVGSNLTYLISGLESSNMLLKKHETVILEKKIEKMQSSARESMQQLRDSIWALNNETVALTMLVTRFGTWLEHIMEAAPATMYSVSNELAADPELDPIKSLNLFRILQEAVHNVVKHASATVLTVSFSYSGNKLVIIITDNGRGFDIKERAGNGRQTMASRAEEMGAHFKLSSAPGTGTTIALELMA